MSHTRPATAGPPLPFATLSSFSQEGQEAKGHVGRTTAVLNGVNRPRWTHWGGGGDFEPSPKVNFILHLYLNCSFKENSLGSTCELMEKPTNVFSQLLFQLFLGTIPGFSSFKYFSPGFDSRLRDRSVSELGSNETSFSNHGTASRGPNFTPKKATESSCKTIHESDIGLPHFGHFLGRKSLETSTSSSSLFWEGKGRLRFCRYWLPGFVFSFRHPRRPRSSVAGGTYASSLSTGRRSAIGGQKRSGGTPPSPSSNFSFGKEDEMRKGFSQITGTQFPTFLEHNSPHTFHLGSWLSTHNATVS